MLPGRQPWLRWGYLAGLNWALLAYAALSIGIGWAYVILRVHADYDQALTMERNRLRGVSAALEASTLAMINDGVGAAVAGANELQAGEGLILANRAEIVSTLRKQLAGGGYVRYLFLTDGEHFALAGREGASGAACRLPGYHPARRRPKIPGSAPRSRIPNAPAGS